MLLTDIPFQPFLDTSSADLINDFFVPALSTSIRYDRGVGYFSSGWLRITARGMVQFAANSGRARWVTSPILSEVDWEALVLGSEARQDDLLRLAILRNITDLQTTLEQDTLSALAWMIADGILDFKLALPINKLAGGDFHDKFGIFTDVDGNRVSFNGSYNESIKGTRNYESIKIFQSWIPAFEALVMADVQRFERLWLNQDPNVRVVALPEAAREQIVRLRTSDRPYPEPTWLKFQQLRETKVEYTESRPRLPNDLQLRDYQHEAIKAWFEHECRGLLEMATGTGKTITALAATVQLYQQEGQLAVIITVPYKHLVDQWQEEAKLFAYRAVLAYESKASWIDDLNQEILEFNGGYRKFISVITTHTTFISADFQASIARLGGPTVFIADEAHHLGAERSRQNYPEMIPFRLALSATPDRWFDDEGTAALRAYFGETVFAFSLQQAIGVSLTPYYYYPHLVELTDAEMEEYVQLSTKIARLMNRSDEDGQNALTMLLIRRANLLNTAENKLTVLSKLIDEVNYLEHTLFYCSPGQIDAIVPLLGWEKGLLVHRFTAEEDTATRKKLLQQFAEGELQALVAMKCLDEGVDVPSTRTAFFLASSSNPREFIQRRGRVLRRAPGKEHSIIHDLIAIPPDNFVMDSAVLNAERSIMRRELQRFKEFAGLALNKYQAIDVIWDVARRYGIRDF